MNKLTIMAGIVGATILGGVAFSSMTVPNAPSNVKVEYKNSCNYVTWQDNSYNEDGFILWRMDSDGEWDITNAGLKKNWYYYNDCNINPNVTYTYAITSFNRAGASSFSNQFTSAQNSNPSIENNVVENQTNFPQDVPKSTEFEAIKRANGTVLRWKIDKSPNYFDIYRYTNGNWKHIAQINGITRSYFDPNCNDGVSNYAIRSWNGTKLSDISTRKYSDWIYVKYPSFAPAPVVSKPDIQPAPVVTTPAPQPAPVITAPINHAPIQPAPVYKNGNITNFSIITTSSQEEYSNVALSWEYDGNNPDTYFILERKSDGNEFETISNIDFYQNQSKYSFKTTISHNINYTYRIKAYTNGFYSNSLSVNIYKYSSPQPAPVVTVPAPQPAPVITAPSCGNNGCNKCNGQEGCLPDFYFGKCYYDEDKDLLYVDVCNGGSDYDFGYYNTNNFLYYYNNLANQTSNDIFKGTMKSGRCETKSFKVGTSYVKTNMSGPFKIKMTLDGANNIQETNERNNEFVYTIR